MDAKTITSKLNQLHAKKARQELQRDITDSEVDMWQKELDRLRGQTSKK